MMVILQVFHRFSFPICCAILTVSAIVSSQSTSGVLQHPKLVRNAPPGSDSATDMVTNSMAYIIRLNDTTADVTSTVSNLMNTSAQDGGEIRFVYSHVFKGFSVNGVSNERMIEILDDSAVFIASTVSRMSIGFLQFPIFPRFPPPLTIQKNAIWNLDELTEPFDDSQYKYRYSGKGVRAYILDTGLEIGNAEFGNRAKCGWDGYDTKCVDKHGHGSHVAGTVGGMTYGGAKSVSLIGVKVLNDTGYGEDATVIAGIDYVIAQKKAARSVPMVINMSLGGDFVQIMNDAVQAAVTAGITVVVAAGNDYGGDSCLKSPASAEGAITVGATDVSNAVAIFTNTGACVDIMAPGSLIESVNVCDPATDFFCYPGGSTFLSGTSMAAPHVAAVAAMHLQKNKKLTPAKVWAAMKANGRVGVINDFWGYKVPDLLLSVTKPLV